MNKRNARKLHNGDQVRVRVAGKTWDVGNVVGDVTVNSAGVFAQVQTDNNGYFNAVRHTDLS